MVEHSTDFMTQLCGAVLDPALASEPETRRLIARSIADTLAVAAAGFPEEATCNTLRAYGGNGPRAWSGEACESLEAAILVNGVAAHALDFDDVYIESMAHISTVLLPAVLRDETTDPDRIIAAFAAGLVAARAVARKVGRGHYNRGWHGTGTIGAFAAAAAAGRLEELDEDQMANAFALAASLSGGLQVNFSTQAKPAHAGFAAVAGARAARLAKAGMTGSRAVFGPRGYPALYGVGDGEEAPDADAFALRPDLISLKLYPCCYASHRLIGLTLDARASLGPQVLDPGVRFRFSVPAGSVDILTYDRPENGLQAKFSRTYPVAVGLLKGTPTLGDFTDGAVHRPEVVRLIDRIEVTEDQAQPSGGDIEFGSAELRVALPSGETVRFTRSAIPGSPDDPPSPASLQAKIAGCLAVYEEWSGKSFPALEHVARLGLEDWFDGSRQETAQQAQATGDHR